MTQRGNKVGFSIQTLAAEAASNVRAHWMQEAMLGALCAIVGFLGIALTLGELTGIHDEQNALAHRGQFLIIVAPTGEGTSLSGAECESLSSAEGVVAAGGLVTQQLGRPRLDSSSSINVVTATPGFAGVLWPESRPGAGGSVVVGRDIAESYGLVAGSGFTYVAGLEQRTVRVEEIAKRTTRDERFNNYALVVTPANASVYECWVEASASSFVGVQQLTLSYFDVNVRVSPFFVPDSVTQSPQDRLERRISNYTTLAAGAVVVVCSSLLWLTRRHEFALYRLLGAKRSGVLVMLTLETLWVVNTSVAAGAAAAIAVWGVEQRVAVELLSIDLGRLFAICWLTPLIGFLLFALKNPLSALRGRV